MLIKTQFNVSKNLIVTALNSLPTIEGKLTLNLPENNFFYDKWRIKNEYKNTVWEEILNSLPVEYGEARIIILKSKTSYTAHSDIDDRYHLNLQGENSFLLDLENKNMHSTECDGCWYEMNAGKLHSATNLGGMDRIQLVVRKLLKQNKLTNPMNVKITAIKSFDENNRYYFDQITSKWLNYANKNGKINDFKYVSENEITLNIEQDQIDDLIKSLPSIFKIII